MVFLLDLGSATITGVKDYPPLSLSGVNPDILNLIPIAHCQCTKDLFISAGICRCPFLILVLTPPIGQCLSHTDWPAPFGQAKTQLQQISDWEKNAKTNICLSVCFGNTLQIQLASIYLSIHLSIYPSINQSINQSTLSRLSPLLSFAPCTIEL